MPRVLWPLLTVVAIATLAIFWAEQKPASQVIAEQSAIEATAETAAETTAETTADRITQPPVRQTFDTGPYQLVITATDGWQTPAATGKLYEGSTLLWQKALPHQYGPRFSLVGPQGQVLLVDEFINVASPQALSVIDAAGKTIAQHSFNDVKTALALPAAELTRQATSGWWVSAPPVLNSAGTSALISTGGTTLAVDLATGELSRLVN
jgi:hypothetical protein